MLKFRSIRSNEQNIKLLFNWRRQSFVQKNSLTKITNNYHKHKKWFLDSINKPDYHHWFVVYKTKKIGWICITEPDFKKDTLRWGYYIGERKYMFLGGIIPCYLYNFIFNELNFKHILAETLEHNKMVDEILRLHSFTKLKTFKTNLKSKNKEITRTNYILTLKDWSENIRFNCYKEYFFIPNKKYNYFRNEQKI